MKNILFVFSDQMRFDAIHALGNPVIRTPVFDSIVNRGYSFTSAYTPCPVCVPARYSMHSGVMPHGTGVYENGLLPSVNERKSFMHYLTESGYQTFGAGKMHFAFPEGISSPWGFQERKVCEEDEHLENNDFYQDLKKAGYGYVGDYKGVRSEMYYIPQVSQLPQKLHHSHWVADKCLDFLGRRDRKKPFFMMASFEKPHPPFEPPVPWNKLYRGPQMPLPKNADCNDDVITIWNRFQNRYKYRDQGTDRNLLRQTKAHYYAEVSFIDYNVGRILDQLRAEDLLKDTLVLVAADHGEFLGDYGCYGKRSFLDSAARIPLLMMLPGQEEPIRCSTPVSLIDIFPTLMEYAGITDAPDTEGISLLKTIRGENHRTAVFGEYDKGPMANYMLVNREYKYIYSVPDQKEYLFDRIKDPQELHNIACNSLYVKKTEELRREMISYLRENHENACIEGDHWKKLPKKELNSSPDTFLLFQDPPMTLPHIPGYETPENQKLDYDFCWPTENFDGVDL